MIDPGSTLVLRLALLVVISLTVAHGGPVLAGQALTDQTLTDRALVAVIKPAAGETLSYKAPPGRTFVITFDDDDARLSVEDDDLILSFADGGRIVFPGVADPGLAQDNPPLFDIGGHEVSIYDVAANAADGGQDGGPATLPEIAHPAINSTGGQPITVRGLLFGSGGEESGFALYSYLLFTPDGLEGVLYQRRRSAILAYLHGYIDIGDLNAEERAAQPINLFSAPVKVTDRAGPGSVAHDVESLQTILTYDYDFVLSRKILARLGLNGNGPYIVSHSKPISKLITIPPAVRDRMLIQDLGWVPPELVKLWVQKFQEQAARQKYWDQVNFKQFALRLRSGLALLAKDFAITEKALAETIDLPD